MKGINVTDFMKHNGEEVEATFECMYIELPDQNLTQKTLKLAPSIYFGDQFKITKIEDYGPDDLHPNASKATARMSKRLYSIMIRVQQGEETSGHDAFPLWALVDGSATEIATGRVIGVGEIFPIFA